MDDLIPAAQRAADRGSTTRRAGPIAGVVVGLALLLALGGCASGSGDPGVASLAATSTGSTGSGATPNAASGASGALAYAKCMRAHGISDFPDPEGGGFRIQASNGSDLAPDNPRFKAAQQACRSLEPTPDPAKRKQMQAALLKFAQCMRAHGISDFPDPVEGGLRIQARQGSDLAPDNPRFKAAQQACQHLMPGGGTFGTNQKGA